MRTRIEIQDQKDEVSRQIRELQHNLSELTKENLLLSDDQQWFTEEIETWKTGKWKKKEVTHLVGRVHWVEDFTDESTGDVVSINRSTIVRIDGEWSI